MLHLRLLHRTQVLLEYSIQPTWEGTTTPDMSATTLRLRFGRAGQTVLRDSLSCILSRG